MILNRTLAYKLTILAIAWLVFTVSLVSWWWWRAVTQTGADAHVQRMFLWEGSFLLSILVIGGAGLVYLTHHHQQRHERLRTFFSTFAHDLKTSITRLRLQGELLEESKLGLEPKVQSMLKEIQRLDLQLENSLWMAQVDSSSLLLQKTRLREIMDHLRNEFAEIRLELNRDAELFVDRRAFTVVLRNLFQNAILHGQANQIEIQIHDEGGEHIRMEITNNGEVLKVPVEKLGREILSGQLVAEKSNGLGLYLSRRLIERMQGRLDFKREPKFCNILLLRGTTR